MFGKQGCNCFIKRIAGQPQSQPEQKTRDQRRQWISSSVLRGIAVKILYPMRDIAGVNSDESCPFVG
eukprot:1755787-Amphidinium_carterae.1